MIVCLILLTLSFPLFSKTILLHAEGLPSFEQKTTHFSEKHELLFAKPKNPASQVDVASYVNRMNPDFYCIFFFNINNKQPLSCTIYSFAWQTTDLWPKSFEPLEFIPFCKAHLSNAPLSYKIGKRLVKQFSLLFKNCAYYQCPFKPLEGIACSALAFEICLPSEQNWITIESIFFQNLEQAITSF